MRSQNRMRRGGAGLGHRPGPRRRRADRPPRRRGCTGHRIELRPGPAIGLAATGNAHSTDHGRSWTSVEPAVPGCRASDHGGHASLPGVERGLPAASVTRMQSTGDHQRTVVPIGWGAGRNSGNLQTRWPGKTARPETARPHRDPGRTLHLSRAGTDSETHYSGVHG